jgi:hypothetical protein
MRRSRSRQPHPIPDHGPAVSLLGTRSSGRLARQCSSALLGLLFPRETPGPVRPEKLRDRQWGSLAEVDAGTEEVRVPAGVHRTDRGLVSVEDVVSPLIGLEWTSVADRCAYGVHDRHRRLDAQPEDADLGTAQCAPEPDGAGPVGGCVAIRTHAHHMSAEVGHARGCPAVALLPGGSPRREFAKEAAAGEVVRSRSAGQDSGRAVGGDDSVGRSGCRISLRALGAYFSGA